MSVLRSFCLFLLAGLLVWPAFAQRPRPGTPAPQYEVRLEKSVLIPMRDGVRLSTDLYVPIDAPAQVPTILIQTPYNKNRYMRMRQPGSDAYFFAGQGYRVAVQDVRGAFESEGVYVVSQANRDDGYDTVAWLAAQPWSNGKVGTYGCSYLGEAQLQLAATRPPHHAAAIPQAAGGAYDGTYRPFLYMDGGAFELASGLSWFTFAGHKNYNRPPPGLSDEEYRAQVQDMQTQIPPPRVNLSELFQELPILTTLERHGFAPSDYKDFVRHIPGDPYWKSLNYVHDADSFNVPTLHVNSWYDLGPNETMILFNLMQDHATGPEGQHQYAIISPTDHCRSEFVRAPLILGERDLGDPTQAYYQIYLDWFDHWLKGVDNGVLDRPRIQYYLMGLNEWRTADAWPIPGTAFTKYYLRSGGDANTRNGDGTLGTEPATGDEPADTYTYDPMNPVPSVGGPICCTSPNAAAAGSYDQSEVELREDVLVYTSEVLAEGLEVTGEMEAVLYVSSDARDTDFTVKLVDVYPDGRAFNVQETILRARYREGYDRVVLMEEGEVYELRLDLHATGNYFGPGHRIRVEVSSSNFPRFDRNLNTGGNNYDESEAVVARNTIHHSARYPSHVVLPIVR